VDFVLAKVAHCVGARAKSPQAPVAYELRKEVVAEAVVHPDYASNASVQICSLLIGSKSGIPANPHPPSLPEA
jgi:hypothetical protein